MSSAISWLHLTDLHVGRRKHSAWPSMRTGLEGDLERIRNKLGNISLIVFSGDLVQTGTAEEYKRLDDELETFYCILKRFDWEPVLFPVPGNHDLERPKHSAPAVVAMAQWKSNTRLSEEIFWDPEAGTDYKEVVSRAFENYTNWRAGWRSRHPNPDHYTERAGLLPGDFVGTLRAGRTTLGLLGINSAFLHLTKETREGDVDIHPEQFNALCEGDPSGWCRRHDFRLLVTHHPPTWLSQRALVRYRDQIRGRDWISLHLCGHMHESLTMFSRLNSQSTERMHQGAALFGLSEDGSNTRIHGYCGFQLDDSADDYSELVVMPRLATQTVTGKYVFGRDSRFELDDTDCLREPIGRRSKPKAQASLRESVQLNALLAEWEPKLDDYLMMTMEAADLPFTDEIIELRAQSSSAAYSTDAEKAMLRYIRGANPSMLDCYLISTRLRIAIENDDPTPCRVRPFVNPVHQYLAGAIRREPEASRARAVATLSRWLTSHDVYAVARDFAAFELGMCRAHDALPQLLAALANPQETHEVRLYSAMAVGMLRKPSAVNALLDIYAKKVTPDKVREAVAHAVVFIGRNANKPE